MALPSGQTTLSSTEFIIAEINTLLHVHIDKSWAGREWLKRQDGEPASAVHPLINVAFLAHRQIQDLIASNEPRMTAEIWEVAELAIKINALKMRAVKGIDERIKRLTSDDFSLYLPTRYELQIGGMLLSRGYKLEFIEEGATRTPDIRFWHDNAMCEIECKHKDLNRDQIDFVRSIYNSTQIARRQFSKTCPALAFIEVDAPRFDEFEKERGRLQQEILRALRNSKSLSAIVLTSKISIEEAGDFVYRHRVAGYVNGTTRHPIPDWLRNNLVSQ